MIGRISPDFLVSNVLDRGLVNPGFFMSFILRLPVYFRGSPI
jgi:hypothetical protein